MQYLMIWGIMAYFLEKFSTLFGEIFIQEGESTVSVQRWSCNA